MLQRFTILLVDRDGNRTKHLAAVTKNAGHRVLSARDGDYAHAILRYRGFDFLILSVSDCRAGGVDLLAWAAQMCPRLHMVALSNGELPPELQSSLKSVSRLYLAKPVDIEDLLQYFSQAGIARSFSGAVDAVDILEYV